MTTPVLVDTNVIVDILSGNAAWGAWSAEQLARAADAAAVVINPIIYGELSMGFPTIEQLDAALSPLAVAREPLPYPAGFLAGRAFLEYRRRGGARRSPPPDLYIGAHAAVSGYRLLTRDASRYRTSFPRLEVIAPACSARAAGPPQTPARSSTPGERTGNGLVTARGARRASTCAGRDPRRAP